MKINIYMFLLFVFGLLDAACCLECFQAFFHVLRFHILSYSRFHSLSHFQQAAKKILLRVLLLFQYFWIEYIWRHATRRERASERKIMRMTMEIYFVFISILEQHNSLKQYLIHHLYSYLECFNILFSSSSFLVFFFYSLFSFGYIRFLIFLDPNVCIPLIVVCYYVHIPWNKLVGKDEMGNTHRMRKFVSMPCWIMEISRDCGALFCLPFHVERILLFSCQVSTNNEAVTLETHSRKLCAR